SPRSARYRPAPRAAPPRRWRPAPYRTAGRAAAAPPARPAAPARPPPPAPAPTPSPRRSPGRRTVCARAADDRQERARPARRPRSGQAEAIADAGIGDQDPRVGRVRLDLAPHLGDEDAQVGGGVLVAGAEDRPQQVPVGEDAVGVGGQLVQE